jgi:hypothetical protein
MAFGCLPLAGQERVAMKADLGEYVPKQSVQLRAEGELPDSMITYSSAGEKLSKRDYTAHDERGFSSVYYWDDNAWVYSREGFESEASLHFVEETKSLYIPLMGTRYEGHKLDTWYNMDDPNDISYSPVYATYNEKGQVILIEVKDNLTRNFVSYYFTYNEQGQIVSILDYNYDWKSRQIDYRYNENGDMILLEDYDWRYENYDDLSGIYKWLWNTSNRAVAKFDSQGRKIREERYLGNQTIQKYLLNEYDIYYYSDGYTPNVTPGDNPPVDDRNEGGFDIIINLPIDSIADGSFVIKLPDGYTLDETNTRLSVDFGDFTLVITKQENNSWLLEIRPKGTRSAALRSEDVSRVLAHIVYTVDEHVKRGTYDITVHSIQFETPGGDAVVEPALTVPVRLNHWGVGSEAIAASGVWSAGGSLHIRTAQPATLNVYTLNGALFHQQTLPAGETAVSLPQGTYFVQTGETVKKVLIR